MGGAVMKAVAERDHHARVVARNHAGEAPQGRRGVIGWQQHTAGGKARTFFQMQVGDDEQPLRFPKQRAGKIGHQRDAGDVEPGVVAKREHVVPDRRIEDTGPGFVARGDDVVAVEDLAVPVPADGEVLIEVRACGLNRLDLRVGRSFSARQTRIEPYIDLLNLFNVSTVLTQNNTYGPIWQRPTSIMVGRMIKFGAQVNF